MLKVTDLYAYYGPINALKQVNMEIPEGKITCLIGSNGAGKSTLLKSISGAVNCTGSIMYDDVELIGKSPMEVTRHMICHVPEGRHIFPGLSVLENLEVGTINWHGFFGKKDFDKDLKEVFELFPRLEERKNQMGWSLSGGEQQMLAIGRGLMSRPKVLMMDEPSMGLSPIIVGELFEKIIQINQLKSVTILLVEQNASLAMRASDYCYVIDQGQITIQGSSAEVRQNQDVLKAYLGRFANARSHQQEVEQ